MSRRKVTKASKRRLLFFGTLSIVIIGYFVFSLSYYAMQILKLEQEQKQLKQNLTSLKSDEKNLKTEIEKLKDPDYLARYARENYLYSKDGEIVIKVNSDEKTIEEPTKKSNFSPYIIFGGSLILLFIIGYVVRKSKKR